MYINIISKISLTESDIAVEIPVQTPYSFSLSEWNLGNAPNTLTSELSSNVLFSYDIYLHYLEFDWIELADKYKKMVETQLNFEASKTDENKEIYTQAANTYYEYYGMHWDDFLLLDSTMLPQFHGYSLEISFDPGATTENETFNTLVLTINGQSMEIDIGEVSLHSDSRFDYQNDASEYISGSLAATSPIFTLSNNYEFTAHFIALQDLVLTGYNIYSEDIDVTKMEVRIQSDDTHSANFLWDGKSPIQIKAGSTVEIPTTISSSYLKKPGFILSGFVVFECEVDNATYEYIYEHRFHNYINCYEQYAIYFDGIDFTEYYEEYYYPCVLGIDTRK